MTNEEFQKVVLEQFAKIDQRFSQLETKVDNLPTHEDFTRLESKVDKLAAEGQKDILTMLQLMDSKLTDLQETQEAAQSVIGKHEVSLAALRSKLAK